MPQSVGYGEVEILRARYSSSGEAGKGPPTPARLGAGPAELERQQRQDSLWGERLDVDDLAGLLAFGPHAGEHVGVRALLHVDMARIDGGGQEIRAPFSSFHIEPLNQIGAH